MFHWSCRTLHIQFNQTNIQHNKSIKFITDTQIFSPNLSENKVTNMDSAKPTKCISHIFTAPKQENKKTDFFSHFLSEKTNRERKSVEHLAERFSGEAAFGIESSEGGVVIIRSSSSSIARFRASYHISWCVSSCAGGATVSLAWRFQPPFRRCNGRYWRETLKKKRWWSSHVYFSFLAKHCLRRRITNIIIGSKWQNYHVIFCYKFSMQGLKT